MPESLFQQLLGEAFDLLPPPIRKLHDGHSKVLVGHCDVQRGAGVLSRLFGFVTSLPPAGANQKIRVEITCGTDHECWIRHFRRGKMQSTLKACNHILHERLGLARFRFKLVYDDQRQTVSWQLVHVATLGIPLPIKWFSAVLAEESAQNERYCFNVRAALPVVGMLVHYTGWLDV